MPADKSTSSPFRQTEPWLTFEAAASTLGTLAALKNAMDPERPTADNFAVLDRYMDARSRQLKIVVGAIETNRKAFVDAFRKDAELAREFVSYLNDVPNLGAELLLNPGTAGVITPSIRSGVMDLRSSRDGIA